MINDQRFKHISHNGFLLLALLATCLAIVWSTYDARNLNRERNLVRQQTMQIQALWRQLHLERGVTFDYAHIEDVARKELRMRPPHLGDIQWVNLDL